MNEKYAEKARLLQKEFYKFAGLDLMDIENLLRYMRLNQSKKKICLST